jgi:regulator of replication initiation timing
LDSDLIIRQFEQIEQRIEYYIGKSRELDAENGELKSRIRMLEEELQQKQELENSYQEEKNLVRMKIDGLLSKLDTIAED